MRYNDFLRGSASCLEGSQAVFSRPFDKDSIRVETFEWHV